MRKFVIVALATAALIGLTATFALAGYNGPHPVLSYHGNEYAVVINRGGSGKSLVVYRAVGSLWERLGGTLIARGQSASNGSVYQNIWFSGRKVRTVSGDLRRPFYRHYPNRGGIDF